MSSMPPEISAAIVDHLYDDWRTLVSCVRTNSEPLSYPAIHHLSQTVHINHYSLSSPNCDLLEFVRTFQSQSDLSSLLHSLHIHGSPDDVPSGTFPVFIDFAHFRNLRSLVLSHLLIDLPERFCRAICSIPALEDLSLEGLSQTHSPSGRYRPIADKPPARESIMALRTRLKALRIGASGGTHGIYSRIAVLLGRDYPYEEDELALGVFEVHFYNAYHSEGWTRLIRTPSRTRRLTRLGVTIVRPVDEHADAPNNYHPTFYDMSTCTMLELLSIRYSPANYNRINEDDVQHGSTHMNFIRFLAQFMSSIDELHVEPVPARFPALKQLTLILRGPAMEMLHEHHDTEAFSVLASSLGRSLYPHFREITIIIEAVLSSKSSNNPCADVSLGEVEMWDVYMLAIRGALSPLEDEGVTVQVAYEHI